MKRIFVFGSNEQGNHGAGAALYALQHYGAIMWIGHGIQGYSYGIPTKDKYLKSLPLCKIEENVAEFIYFAENNLEDSIFHVTRIGCGYAKFKDEQIVPMFLDSPVNCEFDPLWKKYGLKSWKEEM